MCRSEMCPFFVVEYVQTIDFFECFSHILRSTYTFHEFLGYEKRVKLRRNIGSSEEAFEEIIRQRKKHLSRGEIGGKDETL